tara:strand:- start:404 stop:799 length:396 start_codon:yes stop_codon:yes gene_type:complete
MNYGCNVADLMKKPEPPPPQRETHSPPRDHFQEPPREEPDKKVRFEDQEMQNIVPKNTVSTFSSLTERKNINLALLILTINLLLNTNAVKELVFNFLPQAMVSSTEYSLLGTLGSGLILSVLVILFISYYY